MPEAWSVPPVWRGETIFCVASGPSSKGLALAGLRGRPVIAVNDNYRRCPWAPLLYFCDWQWWSWHRGRPAFEAFGGLKVSLDARVAEADPRVRWLRNGDEGVPGSAGRRGLCLERDRLKTGRNSGYQAVNLALHLGARRIVLVGYDMKPGPAGEEHWFGQHRDLEGRPVPTSAGCMAKWAALFETMLPQLAALDVEVLNAGPDSAIDCFPRVRLDDLL